MNVHTVLFLVAALSSAIAVDYRQRPASWWMDELSRECSEDESRCEQLTTQIAIYLSDLSQFVYHYSKEPHNLKLDIVKAEQLYVSLAQCKDRQAVEEYRQKNEIKLEEIITEANVLLSTAPPEEQELWARLAVQKFFM
uniref:Secreted protein n=1 Tax=Heterorhabditis bacteriophora TaxID=37862 RepID=A0A1I7WML2_HETBA